MDYQEIKREILKEISNMEPRFDRESKCNIYTILNVKKKFGLDENVDICAFMRDITDDIFAPIMTGDHGEMAFCIKADKEKEYLDKELSATIKYQEVV